jgi:hypothetical protein
MKIVKKNLPMIVIAVLIITATTILALLPWQPVIRQPGKINWNEAQASITRLIEDVQSNNYDCPFASVNRMPVNARNWPHPNSERTRIFVEEALPIIRQQRSVRDRILLAASLAIRCKVFFGSCGRSAGAIYGLAGISDRDDPAPTATSLGCMFSDDGCNLDIRKRLVPNTDEGMYLTGTLSTAIRGRNCASPLDVRDGDCFTSGSQATQRVRTEISGALQNYPNRWTDFLEPGDWLYIYNGNSTSIGSHSVIFLGWQNDEGQAWIFEGNPRSWLAEGQGSDLERLRETRVRLHHICIKAECGNYYPVVQVYDPDSVTAID